MNSKSISSIVNLLQFLGGMPLFELIMPECTVFNTSLLNALTYWADILYMSFLYIDKVWVPKLSVSCVSFLKELCSFWNLQYRKYTVFSTFLSTFSYWDEILNLVYDFLFMIYIKKTLVLRCIHYFKLDIINKYGQYAHFGYWTLVSYP